MKTIYITLFVIAYLALAAKAQVTKDPEATKILEKMSKSFKDNPSFQATFEYNLSSTEEKIDENVAGNIKVKGDMYHLKFGEQEIFNNTKLVWTYLEEENEVTIDDYVPTEEDITVNKLYTMWKEGFKYRLLTNQKIGSEDFYVVELNPESHKDVDYSRLELFISVKDNILKRWKIYEKRGRVYTYKIGDFNNKVNFPNSAFEFSNERIKSQNVEVVDLRY